MLHFGERLKQLRKQKGLLQDQLATRLCVTRALISGYETGVKQPSIDMIIKLAYSFHVSTDYLLGLKKSMNVDITDLTENQAKLVHDLISEFKDCNMHVQ